MLKRKLESIVGPISDKVFKEAAAEATNDIRENRLKLGVRTSLEYLVDVMASKILQRIEKSHQLIA